MKKEQLTAWTKKRRGRASMLARALKVSRQAVNSFTNGVARIPPERVDEIRAAMKRIEAMERMAP